MAGDQLDRQESVGCSRSANNQADAPELIEADASRRRAASAAGVSNYNWPSGNSVNHTVGAAASLDTSGARPIDGQPDPAVAGLLGSLALCGRPAHYATLPEMEGQKSPLKPKKPSSNPSESTPDSTNNCQHQHQRQWHHQHRQHALGPESARTELGTCAATSGRRSSAPPIDAKKGLSVSSTELLPNCHDAIVVPIASQLCCSLATADSGGGSGSGVGVRTELEPDSKTATETYPDTNPDLAAHDCSRLAFNGAHLQDHFGTITNNNAKPQAATTRRALIQFSEGTNSSAFFNDKRVATSATSIKTSLVEANCDLADERATEAGSWRDPTDRVLRESLTSSSIVGQTIKKFVTDSFRLFNSSSGAQRNSNQTNVRFNWRRRNQIKNRHNRKHIGGRARGLGGDSQSAPTTTTTIGAPQDGTSLVCSNSQDNITKIAPRAQEAAATVPTPPPTRLIAGKGGACCGLDVSVSYQSCLKHQLEAVADVRGGCVKHELSTGDRSVGEQSSPDEILPTNYQLADYLTRTPPHEQQQQANNDNMSGTLNQVDKFVGSDERLKQSQQHQGKFSSTRLDDRRSTYCSSIGAMTSDLNYDSSMSSAANCSAESQQDCPIMQIQDCPREAMQIRQEREARSQQQHHHHGAAQNREVMPANNNNNNDNNNNRSNQFNIAISDKNIEPDKSPVKKRENWDKNIEFLLAVIGFAVDLGNVWRFPYICYKNGGGAFLIPYTVMFILGGLPIFYLEMSLGQYFSSGCLTVWRRVCPMAKGIGYAMCVLNFFTGLYYNTVISWAVFFFVESFTNDLPWTSCNNSWNSHDCRTIDQRQGTRSNFSSSSHLSADNQSISSSHEQVHFSTPTKDYFEREVLGIHLSTGIDDLGSIRKPLAIYLAIVFVCIYFAIWKGVKSTGKAVWITALLPYFVLIPLLVRGVFLEGAWLGIRYYLYPEWMKIVDVDVWVEAAKQIYFSLGPGFGTLMALSSYNKFNHNCHRDALIAATVNYFASFISGLVIFAVLGYMATIEGVSIGEVATEGPGLVFQVYPEGLATMRFSPMWSVLFFIMVITLGIDSTFGGLESVITGLCDEYPRVLRAHRGVFIGLLIILIYLCSLPTTTNGGNYVIYVLESYGTSLSLLFIVLVETIIICWLYGADRFCKNLEEMYGTMPGAYWRICWKYISPTILLLIFVAACGQELDKYHTLRNGDYTYPSWSPTAGLLMTGASVCCVPIYAVYYVKTKTSGSLIERLKMATRPIEGDQKSVKVRHVDALADKIRDHNDIHLDTDI